MARIIVRWLWLTLSLPLPAIESVQPLDSIQNNVGRWVSDASFVTVSGRTAKFADFKNKSALVIAFFKHNCPLSKKFAPDLSALIQEFQKRNVGFVIVNTSNNITNAKLKKEIEKYGFQALVAYDRNQHLATLLKARTTTEMFLLDSARTIRYRGPLSDQHAIGGSLPKPRNRFLRTAIESILAGKEVATKALVAPGCALGLPSKTERPSTDTYHNRISRIIQQNCQPCHRPGGGAPFSLMEYAEVVDFAPMIRYVVEKKIMPPWFADPRYGKWRNDRSLSTQDRKALIDWIDNKMPLGSPANGPLPINWPTGWKIGKPDLILESPMSFDVPATGSVRYQQVKIFPNFKKDRWIQAFEIRPSSPHVVHHMLAYIRYPKGHPRYSPELRQVIAGYVPGNSTLHYADHTASFFPKEAHLELQIHYSPNGNAATDKPRIGLVFAEKKPKWKVETSNELAALGPKIPAHHPNFEIRVEQRIDKPIQIRAFLPHMHVRGKAFRYEITRPNGSTETLLEVPRYNFNWQLRYLPKRPIGVEAGSVLRAIAWYDNSINNPYNPDPSIDVTFGNDSLKEMMLGYYEFAVPVTQSDGSGDSAKGVFLKFFLRPIRFFQSLFSSKATIE